jgi:hypothetical protein
MSCGLSYAYLFHQILWHFSYRLVIDWSLSRGKYTLPAERSEEQSCCYRACTLAVDLRSALLHCAPLPSDRSKQECVPSTTKKQSEQRPCRLRPQVDHHAPPTAYFHRQN